MEFLTVVVSVRKIGENDRVALHVRFVFFGCVRSLVTLAMRAWRVTGKFGDFGRERECLENH